MEDNKVAWEGGGSYEVMKKESDEVTK